MSKFYDIAIIGAGSCGIASTIEAKIHGKEAVLLEKGDSCLQTVRKYYKDGKRVDKAYKGFESYTKGNVDFHSGTKESTIEHFDHLLVGVNVLYNCEVEKCVKVGDKFEVHYSKGMLKAKNVIIAVGKMGKPNKPSYKIPASLSQRVNFNLDKCAGNEKILVVGGGNSAAEYAVALTKNNDVTLSYRKPEFTRLNDLNKADVAKAAEEGKLKLKMGSDIEGLDDAEGKVAVNFIGSEREIYDRVIYAIGGTTPVDFLKKCAVTFDENGLPKVDENCESEVKGLYIGGDLITKNGGSIVFAINNANTIITHIAKEK